ncbi:MAG: hypothetical protein FWG91_08615 [Lachnospiraceae bacterium]|nr:hypothetical protein [Lachnospiraceae bacterium]
MFNSLSANEEKVLQYVIDNEESRGVKIDVQVGGLDENECREIVENLVRKDYVSNSAYAKGDGNHKRWTLAVTLKHPGRDYFNRKKLYKKEQKKLTHREWKIAITSALVGAIIGLIP